MNIVAVLFHISLAVGLYLLHSHQFVALGVFSFFLQNIDRYEERYDWFCTIRRHKRNSKQKGALRLRHFSADPAQKRHATCIKAIRSQFHMATVTGLLYFVKIIEMGFINCSSNLDEESFSFLSSFTLSLFHSCTLLLFDSFTLSLFHSFAILLFHFFDCDLFRLFFLFLFLSLPVTEGEM